MTSQRTTRHDHNDDEKAGKRPWRTPRIERLLSQGSAAGPMITTNLGGTPAEGKVLATAIETMANFMGGPS